jgi:hypothetical protein
VRPRQKRYRERVGNGCGVFSVEANIVNLEHLLETAKLLPVGADHDHGCVQVALNKFIDVLISDLTRQNEEL